MKIKDYGVNSITDAFLALNDILDEEIQISAKKPEKPLKEAASINLNNSEDVELAQNFRAKDQKVDDDTLEVIDADADNLNALKDSGSYIGKILLQCNSCRSTRFLDVDKLAQNENDPELYNVEDECPHCHNIGTGYTLVGQVGKKTDETASFDNDTKNEEEPLLDNTAEVEPEATETAEDDTEETETENNTETSYDETNAEDDTNELDLPELGDEFDVDDVAEDDTEESEEDKKKVKKESLQEEVDVHQGCGTVLPDHSVKPNPNYHGAEIYQLPEEKDKYFVDMWLNLPQEVVIERASYTPDELNDSVEFTTVDEAKKAIDEILDELFENYIPTNFNEELIQKFLSGKRYSDDLKLYMNKYGNAYMETYYTTYSGYNPSPYDPEPYEHSDDVKVEIPLSDIVDKFATDEFTEPRFFMDLLSRKFENLNLTEEQIEGLAYILITIELDNNGLINDSELEDMAEDAYLTEIEQYMPDQRESLDTNLSEKLDMATFEGSIANLIDTFTIEDNPVNIKLLNKNGSELGMYSSDDLPFNVKSQMMDTFNTDDNYLEINVTENGNDEDTKVNDLFNYYRPDEDNQTTFVVTNVDTDEEEDFEELSEFLETYGDYYIDGALGLRTLNIYIADGDLETEVEPLDDEEIEELGKENAEKEVTEESLIESIITLYPNLKIGRLNNILSEEYFIAESIKSGEDLDKVYDLYVKPTNNAKLIEDFKSYTGYEDEVDKFLKEHNISKEKYNKIINEEIKEENKKEETVTDVVNEKLLTSVKTRAELGEAISKLVAANEKYRIQRSLNENYRYDIFVNESFNEGLFDVVADKDELNTDDILDDVEEVDAELVDTVPSTDVAEPVETTDIVPEGMRPEDVEIVQKIDRIATDICNAIQDTYGLDVSDKKNLVVADIIQDLQLIGGQKVIDDLEDTPINELTKQMYQEFNGFYDAMDELASFFTGEKITTSQAERLQQAINSLDGDQFTTENIYQQIASPRFLQAAQQGYIPFIDAEQLEAPVEESLNEADEKEPAKLTFLFNDMQIIYDANKEDEDGAKEFISDLYNSYPELFEGIDRVDISDADSIVIGNKTYSYKDNNLVVSEGLEMNSDNADYYDTERRLGELTYLKKQRPLTDDEAEELAYCENEVASRMAEQDYLNGVKEDVDINIDEFDESMNEYFNSEELEESVVYTTTGCHKIKEGIEVRGLLESESNNTRVIFTLKENLNESNNENKSYIVTNNLTDEEFTLNM